MKNNPQWKQNAMDLASFYEDDLSSSHNIDMELVSWEIRWSDQQDYLPSMPDLTLRQCQCQVFSQHPHTS